MQTYNDPNAQVDAPVKKQILLVLAGFAITTAVIATIINLII
jgi:hypothetical protein